ncbi:hypothetical protein B0T16DRAFT_393690 [Cercophora newfieldiana]|uniref:NACHT domain-containing protein n=1 Tax=Cercophora newfieldiana TaxID=92897 RepID=A0AA40CL29_9PEZI|nr:hypothetical protein B0T16DRAFT_393690 [Cercophora newfieldiana]
MTGQTVVPPISGVDLTPTGSCWELALKPWQIFNTELTRDPKKIIYARKGIARHPTCPLSDVLAAAREYANGSRAGPTPGFRYKMQVFLQNASRYFVAIDVMVQHSPEITALVWGCIRLCLMFAGDRLTQESRNQTAAQQPEISDYIADTVTSIMDQIGRSEKYYQLHAACPRVCSAVSRLYAQIINFVVRAAEFRKNRGLGYIPWAIFVGSPAEKRLRRVEMKIKELSIAVEYEAHLAFQERQTEEANTRQLLEWLKPAMPPATPSMSWEEGTCEWICRHQSYRTWAQGGHAGPLWIHGIPGAFIFLLDLAIVTNTEGACSGCGKSMIASYLSKTADTKFVFSYTYALSESQGPVPNIALAASILFQVLKSGASLTGTQASRLLCQDVRQLLNRYPSCASCRFDEVWPCVEKTLSSAAHDFTLIVDALDECRDANHVQELLRRLDALGKQVPGARIIIVSRFRDDYKKLLPGSVPLPVDTAAVSSDILLFVQREVDRAPALKPLRNTILGRVEEESQGMFLWAKMMMDCLKTAATTNTQHERLRRFPVGLGPVYDQFLGESGLRLEEQEIQLRAQIFSLLVAAERPLSLAELSQAVALRSTSIPPSPGDVLINPGATIVHLCSPLVSIDAKDDRVRLIHHSLREFLLSPAGTATPTASLRITNEEAHRRMARVCVNLLCQPAFASVALIDSLVRRNVLPEDACALTQGVEISKVPSLYEYASFHWHIHVALSPADENLAGQVGRFLTGIEFIAWAEAVFHLRDGHDLGPVLSARAALLGWHAMRHVHIRERTGVSGFFTGPYQAILESLAADNILRYLVLHRLGTYFNLAVEEHDSRFQIIRTVMEKSSAILGPAHAFTLRSRAEYGAEILLRERFEEAEVILRDVYTTQSSSPSPSPAAGTESQYVTLSNYATALHHQLKLDESIAYQQKASEGLLQALGPADKKYLKSQLFLAQALEAQNHHLDDALAIYEKIWEVWVPMYSRDEGLAMFAQIGMATVLRKKGGQLNLNKAMQHGTEVLENRRRVFGEANSMTADTALTLAAMCLDCGEYGRARGYLSLVPSQLEIGAADAASPPANRDGNDHRIWLHRHYLAEALRASVHHQTGKTEKAIADLRQLLGNADAAGGSGSRALLQARLVLSDLLEAQGRPKMEVLRCFSGLVEEVNGANRLVSGEQVILEATRQAARHLLSNRLGAAEMLLETCNMRWRRKEDYWIPIGGPFADI